MLRTKLVPLLVGTTALCAASCAGATKQDLFDKDGPSPATGTSGTSGTSDTSGTSGGTSGTSGGTSGTGGSVVDSGTTDAGAVCAPELEPNDERGTANVLAGSVCGSIDVSSDEDVDYFTFALAPATKSVRVNFDGKVAVRVEVQGYSILLGSGADVPFVKEGRYYVQVKRTNSGSSSKTVPYRIDVIEK